jgi:hypothetical protein
MNRKLMYQYAEIVSSNTVDICVDERALQDHGRLWPSFLEYINRCVAEVVVDVLQPVHVREYDAHMAISACCGAFQFMQSLVQSVPVHDVSQKIDRIQGLELINEAVVGNFRSNEEC